MSLTTREELKNKVKRGEVDPLYLFFGTEEFLRERATRAVADLALKSSGLREFNETTYKVSESSIQEALAAANQLPMMSDRRVVVMTDFAKIRDADEEALAHYLHAPCESSTVILVIDELDKRRKITKTLTEKCVAVEFAPLKGAELTSWAKSHLRELKVEADERTLHYIIGLVGSNVRLLTVEFEKLATAALPSSRITMDLVDQLVGQSSELSNFDLGDQIVARNRSRALQTLRRILEDGAEPVMLVGLIAGNFHRLALAKELMAQGASENEVFRAVGPYYGERRSNFLATARRASAA